MSQRNTSKKVTRVGGDEPAASGQGGGTFVPTAEAKGKATRLRVIAGLLWALAIGAQLFAINLLFKPPVNMVWLIALIVIDLALVVVGSMLWKQSNRLDPASEKNKIMFFMQNQLGLVMAIIAFLPLIILIFMNKDLDGKQKGILGGVAVVALLIAGISGIDFAPPSIEQYTEQTQRVEWLNEGRNNVYWTKSGTVFHVYDDCSHINTDRTVEIFEGTVAQARELKNITNLCNRCENRAIRERGLNEADFQEAVEELVPEEVQE